MALDNSEFNKYILDELPSRNLPFLGNFSFPCLILIGGYSIFFVKLTVFPPMEIAKKRSQLDFPKHYHPFGCLTVWLLKMIHYVRLCYMYLWNESHSKIGICIAMVNYPRDKLSNMINTCWIWSMFYSSMLSGGKIQFSFLPRPLADLGKLLWAILGVEAFVESVDWICSGKTRFSWCWTSKNSQSSIAPSSRASLVNWLVTG